MANRCKTVVQRRWTLIAGFALAAMVGGGLFQLLRPTTYVAVARTDISGTLLPDQVANVSAVAEAEAGYVTAPEVVAATRAEMGTDWDALRTIKASENEGSVRIAVSSYDPAVAEDGALTVATQHAAFLNRRIGETAASQRAVLFDASTRLRADLVATNERISELGGASPDQISSSDLALATLMADREVTLDLLVELDTRADQLSDLAPASVIGVDTPIASSPNIGLSRLALLGALALVVAFIAAMAIEPVFDRRAARVIDLRQTRVIDLRNAITTDTPARRFPPQEGDPSPLG